MAPSNDDEPTLDTRSTAETTLDRVLHHVALEAMDGEPTDDSIRWSESLYQRTQSQLAALRRQPAPATASIAMRNLQFPAEYRDLDRAALIARIDAVGRATQASYQHLELTQLSDDDLRRLLARLEEPDPER